MSGSYPKDADGDALRRVVRDGSDMSRPMVIDFFVAVPNEERGREVAAAASTVGYKTKVVRDDESKEWTCYCTKSMLATYDTVVSAQKALAGLSAEFEGYPDGWGTFGNVDAPE